MTDKKMKIVFAAGGLVAVAAVSGLIIYLVTKDKKSVKPIPPSPIVPSSSIGWSLGPMNTILARRSDGKRANGKPSVGCYSPNQKYCWYDGDAAKTMATLDDKAPILWCGEQHRALFNDDGYSAGPNHWCNSI
jgi:hypothetical protein